MVDCIVRLKKSLKKKVFESSILRNTIVDIRIQMDLHLLVFD